MNRSEAREYAFKMVYGLEVQKEFSREQYELFMENAEIKEKAAINYLEEIFEGIEKNKEEILDLISQNLKKDWTIQRISKVNLAILEIAIFEIKYTDIPFKVAINEAVELAKEYSDEKVKNMINAVLDSIYHGEENE